MRSHRSRSITTRGDRSPPRSGILEKDNPTGGLGYLIVRNRAVAEQVKALRWSAETLRGGEDVLAIGFGQGGLEWGVIKGTVASVSGSDVMIDRRIEEGGSGSPILMNGSVAGMVTSSGREASASASRALSSRQRSGDGVSRSPRRHRKLRPSCGQLVGGPQLRAGLPGGQRQEHQQRAAAMQPGFATNLPASIRLTIGSG